MDMGFRRLEDKPMIFEKSLKLLATLSQFPTFMDLMNTSLDSFDIKLTKYINKISDILKSTQDQNLISVMCEQLEKIVGSGHI